jgi:hypothetical protein
VPIAASASKHVCLTIKANKSPDRSGHLSEPSSADTSKVLGKDSKHWRFVQEVKPLFLRPPLGAVAAPRVLDFSGE